PFDGADAARGGLPPRHGAHGPAAHREGRPGPAGAAPEVRQQVALDRLRPLRQGLLVVGRVVLRLGSQGPVRRDEADGRGGQGPPERAVARALPAGGREAPRVDQSAAPAGHRAARRAGHEVPPIDRRVRGRDVFRDRRKALARGLREARGRGAAEREREGIRPQAGEGARLDRSPHGRDRLLSRRPSSDLVRAKLLAWFRRERRALPWRGTRDPYRIWVSEVMLQQTTVGAVRGRYEKFLERFPDLASL